LRRPFATVSYRFPVTYQIVSIQSSKEGTETSRYVARSPMPYREVHQSSSSLTAVSVVVVSRVVSGPARTTGCVVAIACWCLPQRALLVGHVYHSTADARRRQWPRRRSRTGRHSRSSLQNVYRDCTHTHALISHNSTAISATIEATENESVSIQLVQCCVVHRTGHSL